MRLAAEGRQREEDGDSFPLAGTGEEREVESRESFACFGGAAARKRLYGPSSPGSDCLPAGQYL
jgi:hypothetical protein